MRNLKTAGRAKQPLSEKPRKSPAARSYLRYALPLGRDRFLVSLTARGACVCPVVNAATLLDFDRFQAYLHDVHRVTFDPYRHSARHRWIADVLRDLMPEVTI